MRKVRLNEALKE